MKIQIAIIIAIITLAIISTSCSRESSAKAKTPDILKQNKIDPNEVFSLSRKGESVSIQLLVDLTSCRRLEVFRNTTGAASSRTSVALLTGRQSHEDLVPDAGAYWYWLLAWPPKGNAIWIGPLRAGPDTGKIGNYVKRDDNYKLQVTRNETNARVAWDVPKENFKDMRIRRDTISINNRKKPVIDGIREPAGQANDALPDIHADYWYWMEVLLENGTIITRGPIKAKYREE